MMSPEAVINVFCIGFFAILAYAVLRLVMFGRRRKFTGVIQSPQPTFEMPMHKE